MPQFIFATIFSYRMVLFEKYVCSSSIHFMKIIIKMIYQRESQKSTTAFEINLKVRNDETRWSVRFNSAFNNMPIIK